MPSFQRPFLQAEPRVLETVFWPADYADYIDKPLESLVGIFAAKAAAGKTLSQPAGHWLDPCVEPAPLAEPLMKRVRDFPKVEALQVSIAHAGDDAPARVAVQTRL